jgi:ubiquitin-protein ligase
MNERDYVHLQRLKMDYEGMLRLKGSIEWKPLTVAKPENSIYPTKYNITYTDLLAPIYPDGTQQQHTLEIDCSSADYPLNSVPVVTFITPIIKHPHVWENKKVCLGGFPLEESLPELCIRLARFFQYDPALINPNSIATPAFYQYYLKNHLGLPLSHQPLPYVEEEKKFVRKGRDQGSQNSSLHIINRRS